MWRNNVYMVNHVRCDNLLCMIGCMLTHVCTAPSEFCVLNFIINMWMCVYDLCVWVQVHTVCLCERHPRERVEKEGSFSLASCFRCINSCLADPLLWVSGEAEYHDGQRVHVRGCSPQGRQGVEREEGRKGVGNRYNLQRHVLETYFF